MSKVRSGTSKGSPIVSGAVDLLLQKCPNITNTETRNIGTCLELTYPEAESDSVRHTVNTLLCQL